MVQEVHSFGSRSGGSWPIISCGILALIVVLLALVVFMKNKDQSAIHCAEQAVDDGSSEGFGGNGDLSPPGSDAMWTPLKQ